MAEDPVRDEAARLVAAAIEAATLAARSLGGRANFATGSAECCICPVCRVIAAMRDPDPDLTDRLSSGAGDLAAGVASLLRAFARPGPGEETRAGDEFWEGMRQRAREEPAKGDKPAKKMAKKAVRKTPREAPPG